MRKFLLFLAGLAAAILIIANLGPMILLGVSIWLIYLIFKQFTKAGTTIAKIGWVILGLIIVSIGISNFYAVIGIGAGFVLYLVYKHWNEEDNPSTFNDSSTDPFINFEHQWNEINK